MAEPATTPPLAFRLRAARCFPHPAANIEFVETHMARYKTFFDKDQVVEAAAELDELLEQRPDWTDARVERAGVRQASVDRLLRLTRGEVNARFGEFKKLTHFEEL